MTAFQILGTVVFGVCTVIVCLFVVVVGTESDEDVERRHRQPRHVVELDRYRRPQDPIDWEERGWA